MVAYSYNKRCLQLITDVNLDNSLSLCVLAVWNKALTQGISNHEFSVDHSSWNQRRLHVETCIMSHHCVCVCVCE